MVVCTWYVPEVDVHLNGVGCVKQNGRETAWVPIGLVNKQVALEIKIITMAERPQLFKHNKQSLILLELYCFHICNKMFLL